MKTKILRLLAIIRLLILAGALVGGTVTSVIAVESKAEDAQEEKAEAEEDDDEEDEDEDEDEDDEN